MFLEEKLLGLVDNSKTFEEELFENNDEIWEDKLFETIKTLKKELLENG